MYRGGATRRHTYLHPDELIHARDARRRRIGAGLDTRLRRRRGRRGHLALALMHLHQGRRRVMVRHLVGGDSSGDNTACKGQQADVRQLAVLIRSRML